MPIVLFVLGPMRSGTSVASLLAHEHGVHMGNEFPPATDMNEKGFFECKRAIALHAQLIDQEQNPRTVLRTMDQEKLTAIQSYIREREAPGTDWGVKNRYLPFTFHLFRRYISAKFEVRVIRTRREICDSVRSWAARRMISLDDAKQQIYDTEYAIGMQLKEYIGPLLEVPFEQLIAHRGRWVQKIAEFLGKPVNWNVVDIVDPRLKRF